jgi:uncharacterized membrane protein YfcA
VVVLLALLVVTVCAAIHGAVGFGLNLLAVPLLLVVDPALVPGPALVAGLAIALLVAGRELTAVDRRTSWAVIGLVPGTAAGLGLLAVVPERVLSLVLGLLVLVAVALSAARWQPTPSRPALLVAGTATGFLSTAAAIGGPPMALLYGRSEGARLRSTLSVVFVAASLVALGALTAVGRFGSSDLTTSLVLLPGVVVGFLMSGPLRRRVDHGNTRPAVLALSTLAAIGAILQGLLG